jgi:hypothetical protein
MPHDNDRARRAGNATSPEVDAGGPASNPILTDPTDETCDLCGGPFEVAYRHVSWCARCVAAFLAGLRRRREAELRLPPLAEVAS